MRAKHRKHGENLKNRIEGGFLYGITREDVTISFNGTKFYFNVRESVTEWP